MKVYISCDMEGATGVSNWQHVSPESAEYARFRKLLTGDVNAAVEGAYDAGATEVLVNDAHGGMTNVLIEELDPRARLISGENKQLLQMEGIDRGFDAAFFIAYHSQDGTASGVLNHTFMSRTVNQVRLNGRALGETGINACIAAAYGVPVLLVTGDDRVAAEAREFLGPVETVEVKRAIDRFVADQLAPARTRQLITEAAAKALAGARLTRRGGSLSELGFSAPYRFEVDFKVTASVTGATLFHQVKREGPKTISLSGDDFLQLFREFWGAVLLGAQAAREEWS